MYACLILSVRVDTGCASLWVTALLQTNPWLTVNSAWCMHVAIDRIQVAVSKCAIASLLVSRSLRLDAAVTVLSWLPWQGLAESRADEAAGRALRRQDLLAGLHNTVQQRLTSTAQQGATHQALLDRQACQTAQPDCNNKLLCAYQG